MQISQISHVPFSQISYRLKDTNQSTHNISTDKIVTTLPSYSQNIYMINFKGCNNGQRKNFDFGMVAITMQGDEYNKNIKFRHPEPNILTGPNLHRKLDSGYYEFMKDEYGLEGVILLSEGMHCSPSVLSEKMQEAGLEFLHFNLDGVLNFSNNEYFASDNNGKLVVKDVFVDKLKKYFELLNTKNIYMGCEQGIDRTNVGILLNYCFNNPKRVKSAELAYTPFIRGDVNYMMLQLEKLYNALTDEQKTKLGIKNPVFINPLDKIQETAWVRENPYRQQKWSGHVKVDTNEPCSDYKVLNVTGEEQSILLNINYTE